MLWNIFASLTATQTPLEGLMVRTPLTKTGLVMTLEVVSDHSDALFVITQVKSQTATLCKTLPAKVSFSSTINIAMECIVATCT